MGSVNDSLECLYVVGTCGGVFGVSTSGKGGLAIQCRGWHFLLQGPFSGWASPQPKTKPLRFYRGLILSQLEGRQRFEDGDKQGRQKLADK